jgi:hypothetical protein
VFKRALAGAALMAVAVMSSSLGCRSAQRSGPDTRTEGTSMKAIHYLEIVSNDVDALCGLYERVHGFGASPRWCVRPVQIPALRHARTR